MHFGLTSEQQMLVDSVRAFVEAELTPHEDEVERTDKVRPELIQQIHAARASRPASMPPTCRRSWAAAGSIMSR